MEQTLSEIESKIKEYESRVALYIRQLQEHEEGIRKLSPMVKTSSETKLENTKELLEEYKHKQKQLLELDVQALVKKDEELLKARREQYFKHQIRRIKFNREHTKKVKIEVLKTIEELPDGILFEDEELFDLALMSVKFQIRDHVEVFLKYNEIKKDFESMLEDIDVSVIDDYLILNEHIPFVILNFYIIVESIKDSKKDSKNKFVAFPKYQDWWISELWSSHQAYYSLYKWQYIILGMCVSDMQKKFLKKVFIKWINIKRVLNQKGAKAYGYTLVFDNLLKKYIELEEELEDRNIEHLEKVMKKFALKENFTKSNSSHNIITPYLEYKKTR